jgi:hypothetical protein
MVSDLLGWLLTLRRVLLLRMMLQLRWVLKLRVVLQLGGMLMLGSILQLSGVLHLRRPWYLLLTRLRRGLDLLRLRLLSANLEYLIGGQRCWLLAWKITFA